MATTRAVSVRRLNALFQRAVEPVLVLDAERRFVYVNRAWEELTGRTLDEVQGLACQPHGPDREGGLDGLRGSFCPPPEALAGRPAGAPTLVIHAGGERIWRRLEFWPLHDGRGRLVGLLGFVREPGAPAQVAESGSARLRADLLEIRERHLERFGTEALIGRGAAHRRLMEQVKAAAPVGTPVLIAGEPGVGKRLVARTIHAAGPNPKAPLVPLDAAALPPEAIEHELFGEPVDAPPARHRLNLPDGAAIVLADATELPRDVQARLAAAIEAGSRVRVLAVSRVDPELARRDGRLREDLYYALTGLTIRLPPLRERLDELPLLAQHFLERANAREERRRQGFADAAIDALLAYDWPGNLRELARVVDAAHAAAASDLIAPTDLPASIRGHQAAAYNPPPSPPPVTPLDTILEQIEKRLIEQAMQRSRHNKSRAAELLEISRPRLYRRIKELGIPEEPEPAEDGAAG